MILTREKILEQINNGRIKIEPFDEEAVGAASVDLTIDKEIRVFIKSDTAVPITKDTDYRELTRKMTIEDKYVMKPGELILGITKENIKLPGNICGWLNSRSRFARLGLMVHITAPFVQPGISGKQVLEIYNAGPNNLELIPGEKLCQLILEECSGSFEYQGQFSNQEL